MQKNSKILIKNLLFLLAFVVISCKTREVTLEFYPGPHEIVYKTKADYFKNVPVILNDEKNMVLTYPAKEDLKRGDEYQYPVKLKDGWLLDKRGININVAFLNISYEEYYKLEELPTPDSLFEMIIDKNPLTEMCDCGSKTAFSNEIKQLNFVISKGKIKEKCKNLLGK